MNDYSKGALEALAWVQQLMKGLRDDPDGWARMEREVEAAKDDLLSGVGIDFRRRLRMHI